MQANIITLSLASTVGSIALFSEYLMGMFGLVSVTTLTSQLSEMEKKTKAMEINYSASREELLKQLEDNKKKFADFQRKYALLSEMSINQERRLEKIKKIVMKKRIRAPKKFVKRLTTKIVGYSASSTAAVLPGLTAAAVSAVAVYLEAEDYCQQVEELIEQENILFGTDKQFDYKACYDQAINDGKSIANGIVAKYGQSLDSVWQDTKEYTRSFYDRAVDTLIFWD